MQACLNPCKVMVNQCCRYVYTCQELIILILIFNCQLIGIASIKQVFLYLSPPSWREHRVLSVPGLVQKSTVQCAGYWGHGCIDYSAYSGYEVAPSVSWQGQAIPQMLWICQALTSSISRAFHQVYIISFQYQCLCSVKCYWMDFMYEKSTI